MMTREIDRAVENQEHITDMNIEAIREKASKPEVKATGRCLFCEKPLEGDRRWCDKYCCSMWERLRNKR